MGRRAALCGCAWVQHTLGAGKQTGFVLGAGGGVQLPAARHCMTAASSIPSGTALRCCCLPCSHRALS